MPIHDLETRLLRLSEKLACLLEGEVDSIDPHEPVADDPLGRIEETVQFLVMDVKTATMANRDKETSLLMQQEELENHRERILRQAEELAITAATIDRQTKAIRQLSTPILEIWDGVLVLPIIGVLDTHRSEAIMANLLEAIVRKRTKWAIIDITGVEVADTRTADHLMKVVRAAAHLGTSCILSGTRPDIARTLVGLGVDLKEITSTRNLKAALEACIGPRNS